MSSPIAVCFHDPVGGTFTVPEVSVAPALPGVCRVTLEQAYVTFLYEDGSETAYAETEGAKETYEALVTDGVSDSWWDDRPSCPYLTALAKVPRAPGTFGELMRRWSEEAKTAEGRSKHRGTVKARAEFALTYTGTSGPYESEWGVSYRHEFADGADKFVWWTGKELDLIPSETRTVKATVKQHDFYRGERITVLTRVSPLKGENKLVRDQDTEPTLSSL